MDFLNALLPLPADGPIDSVEYLNPQHIPAIPGLLRRGIVDVKCGDRQGRTFIVEMQWLWTAVFQQRMLFSASQAYVQHTQAGRGLAAGVRPGADQQRVRLSFGNFPEPGGTNKNAGR